MIKISPRKELGPNVEMGVGDKLGSIMLSVMPIQKDFQHAHSCTGEC